MAGAAGAGPRKREKASLAVNSCMRQRLRRISRGAGPAEPAKTFEIRRSRPVESAGLRAVPARDAGANPMINVAAIRMHQFGVQFYQAALTANDIDKLVRFEVLRYGDQGHQPVRGGRRGAAAPKINWDLLERRIGSNEKAYQRQIIRRKIEELVAVLRAVPAGARPAVDTRRRHHLVRRAPALRADGRRRAHGDAEGARARGHPARHRRAAPAAGAARGARHVR